MNQSEVQENNSWPDALGISAQYSLEFDGRWSSLVIADRKQEQMK